jgi:hypothetical protein
MTERIIAAEWAWRAKPDDGGDYRVLRASGPPEVRSRLDAQIRASILGIPTAALQGAEDLPWVRFDRTGDGTARTVTWFEWTGFPDEYGRPVVGTSHFAVPSAELDPHRPTLAELLSATFDVDLVGHPEEPARIVLPIHALPAAPRPAELAWAASAAALLLEGPVVIAPRGPDWLLRDRVALFDGILGLLPYPAAAAVSAATWRTASGAGAVRLAVGPPADGAPHLRVGGPAEPATEAGAAYRALLLDIEQRCGWTVLRRELRACPPYTAAGEDPLDPAAATAAVRGRFGTSRMTAG